ncbi:MAG: nitrite/sulfite reductase [Armatimonadota bacterium]
MSVSTFKIADSVIEDTHAYRGEVEKLLTGDIDAAAFRPIRVPLGIYEQRENDTFMVRVRGASGLFLPDQVRAVAGLAERFGSGIVHVTTRQDLQIHKVLIHDTPTILEELLDAGLSTQGGGGDTVRNISACPLAGVCVNEVFDVTPYALALTEYLTADRANYKLPRKFKIAFSGCGEDCALASVADLGFFAHVKDRVRGFSVYAGGGLGARSALAIKIEDFIPAEAIFEVAEAVKRLFDRHGDRTNRGKARLRFVVERFGQDEFRRLYREEIEYVRNEGMITPEIHQRDNDCRSDKTVLVYPIDDVKFERWMRLNVTAQKQEDLYAVRIRLPFGDIGASELIRLADAAEGIGDGTLRTTQSECLQLRGVRQSSLYELYHMLGSLDKRFVRASSITCAACVGASTCRLGSCISRDLLESIEAEISDIDLPFNASIRISGCPNSCGHHPVAQIGLYGTAIRVDGILTPHYTILAGGELSEGRSSLAKVLGRLPAQAVPGLLKEFFLLAEHNHNVNEDFDDLLERWGIDFLRSLLLKHEVVPSNPDCC